MKEFSPCLHPNSERKRVRVDRLIDQDHSSRGDQMNRLQELRDLLTTFEKDFVKFYEKGNKSAGTRVRKHMNELKRKAQEIRKEVQDIKATDKGEEQGTPEQQ
jgi:hypothetical protein